jgi:cell division protein YceG involved in septum cleavage
LSSIKASIDPPRNPYFFFVAKGHGLHAFARTLEEQTRNAQKYLHVP